MTRHPVAWRRGSACDNDNCVEVALGADFVAVRDSKHPIRAALVFDVDEWTVFVAAVKQGEFDVPG